MINFHPLNKFLKHKFSLLFTIITFVFFLFFNGFSQSKKEQIQILNNKLNELNSQLESKNSKIRNIENKVNELSAQLERQLKNYDSLYNQKELYFGLLVQKSDSLKFLYNQITEIRKNQSSSYLENEGSKTEANSLITGDYKDTIIGSQTWMTENLSTLKFKNGDAIPVAKTEKEWINANVNKKPICCYYNFDKSSGVVYYNVWAVLDPRGLAPKGWRVPTIVDFETLVKEVGDSCSRKLKSTDKWEEFIWNVGGYESCRNCRGWSYEYQSKVPCHVCMDRRKVWSPSASRYEVKGIGTNKTGFNALPTGTYLITKDKNRYEFIGFNTLTLFWTTSKNDEQKLCKGFALINDHLTTEGFSYTERYYSQGCSVRCIKD
jgi:uncharacterized protein (TIGR02145 family)